MKFSTTSVGFALFLCLAGCNGEFGAPERDESEAVESEEGESGGEDVGATQDAFTGWTGCTATSIGGGPFSCSASVSTYTQAFLQAVFGNLGYSQGFSPYVKADVFRLSSPPSFSVTAQGADYSTTLGGSGFVVYPASNTISPQHNSHSSATGSNSITLTTPAGNYACFITAVYGDGLNFNSTADGCLLSGNTFTCSGRSSADAQCIPITTYLGYVQQGGSGTYTANLGATDWTNGKVCGLFGVFGKFRTNSTTDGMFTYTSGSTWYFKTTPQKYGYVQCVI